MAYLTAYCGSHPGWLWVPSNAVFTMDSGQFSLAVKNLFVF